MHLVPLYATQFQNFDFNLRRDHEKNSYECRDYESVDENSLAMSRKTTKKRIHALKG